MIKVDGPSLWEGLPLKREAYVLAVMASMMGAVLIFSVLPLGGKAFALLFLAVALNGLSCRELFVRCAAIPADEIAWHEFFRRYHDDICIAIYRVLGFPPTGRFSHLCDDVLQKFSLRLLENDRRALLSFRGKTEVQARAFLRKIAASVAINVLRHETTDSVPLEDHRYSNHDVHPSRSEALTDRSTEVEAFVVLRDEIEHCLNEVLHGHNKFRNMLIFKLAVFEGLSPEEIASIPGLKLNSSHAVEQQLSRMRRKIRRHLNKR